MTDPTEQTADQAGSAAPGEHSDRRVLRKSLGRWVEGGRLLFKLPSVDEVAETRSIASPIRWSETTKLLMGLALLVMVFLLGFALRDLVAPTLLALILVLVLSPVVNFVHKKSQWSWRAAVVVVYLVILAGCTVIILTIGGRLLDALISLVSHASSFLQVQTQAAGAGASEGSNPVTVVFGNLFSVAASLLAGITLATTAMIGWGVYILGVAFFLMVERKPAESSDVGQRLLGGFGPELAGLRVSFTRIWSTWIYGQVILSLLTFVSYFVVMTLLGLPNTLGIALVSMFGRFIPYIGATVTWCLVGLVAYTESPTPFGLSPAAYTALCVGIAIVIDQAFDQIVTPRLYGGAYKIPTALVLIGTVAAGMVMGLFGMFVAAPLMATAVMLGEFIMSRVIEVEPAGPSIGLPLPAGEAAEFPPPDATGAGDATGT